MKKRVALYFVIISVVGWLCYYYFIPNIQNITFNAINHKIPTTIVAVNAVDGKINNDILEHLKKIKEKDEQNIVYATDVRLSRWEMLKLKLYVNHVMAKEGCKNTWLKYQQALSWMMINVNNRKNIKYVIINGETNELYDPKKNVIVSKKDFPLHQKRYAVFAGYNKDGVIEPYVIDYLRGLEEVTDGIVYIADSLLKDGELEKLKDINIIYTKHEKHNRYDFGSYAIGFKWLKDNGYLEEADEIVFANDSTYAPMTSFKPMFDEMDKRGELDFWGSLKGQTFSNHLCSYFTVYRAQIFNSPYFYEILNTLPPKLERLTAIFEYEIKITPYLEALGYKWDAYIDYEELEYLPYPAKDWYPLSLVSKHKSQFFKRRVFYDEEYSKEDIFEFLEYLKQNYPRTYQNVISANHKLLKGITNKDD